IVDANSLRVSAKFTGAFEVNVGFVGFGFKLTVIGLLTEVQPDSLVTITVYVPEDATRID
ncbi:MAG: hypothetical protein ACKVJK_19600, partial [Methylophagaceae bacterium]